MSLFYWAMRRRGPYSASPIVATDEGWEYSVPVEKKKSVDPTACAEKSQTHWASMMVGEACPHCGHAVFAHPPGYCDICRFEVRLRALEARG